MSNNTLDLLQKHNNITTISEETISDIVNTLLSDEVTKKYSNIILAEDSPSTESKSVEDTSSDESDDDTKEDSETPNSDDDINDDVEEDITIDDDGVEDKDKFDVEKKEKIGAKFTKWAENLIKDHPFWAKFFRNATKSALDIMLNGVGGADPAVLFRGLGSAFWEGLKGNETKYEKSYRDYATALQKLFNDKSKSFNKSYMNVFNNTMSGGIKSVENNLNKIVSNLKNELNKTDEENKNNTSDNTSDEEVSTNDSATVEVEKAEQKTAEQKTNKGAEESVILSWKKTDVPLLNLSKSCDSYISKIYSENKNRSKDKKLYTKELELLNNIKKVIGSEKDINKYSDENKIEIYENLNKLSDNVNYKDFKIILPENDSTNDKLIKYKESIQEQLKECYDNYKKLKEESENKSEEETKEENKPEDNKNKPIVIFSNLLNVMHILLSKNSSAILRNGTIEQLSDKISGGKTYSQKLVEIVNFIDNNKELSNKDKIKYIVNNMYDTMTSKAVNSLLYIVYENLNRDLSITDKDEDKYSNRLAFFIKDGDSVWDSEFYKKLNDAIENKNKNFGVQVKNDGNKKNISIKCNNKGLNLIFTTDTNDKKNIDSKNHLTNTSKFYATNANKPEEKEIDNNIIKEICKYIKNNDRNGLENYIRQKLK